LCVGPGSFVTCRRPALSLDHVESVMDSNFSACMLIFRSYLGPSAREHNERGNFVFFEFASCGFWAHPFLKIACSDFCGAGLCRRPWSVLAVAGESTALHHTCFDVCLICTRMSVPGKPSTVAKHIPRHIPLTVLQGWPRNPAHKLTRAAAARFLSNNTHAHTQSLWVCVVRMCTLTAHVFVRGENVLIVSLLLLPLSSSLRRSSSCPSPPTTAALLKATSSQPAGREDNATSSRPAGAPDQLPSYHPTAT
jgi:hypothetical protein